jgi:hypothetical protein
MHVYELEIHCTYMYEYFILQKQKYTIYIKYSICSTTYVYIVT